MKFKWIRPSEIRTDPALTPKMDPQLMTLLEDAIKGKVGVYFAAVPFALCVPFDRDYRPHKHPAGQAAIQVISHAWRNGDVPRLIAYQQGAWFVISDDYIKLFAALRGLLDYIPCWVLGKPDSEFVKDVQGPIAVSEVPGILGISA